MDFIMEAEMGRAGKDTPQSFNTQEMILLKLKDYLLGELSIFFTFLFLIFG